uniref:Uncharacterized protein n=1 Tax=Populus alba TaxID=43335 RepID=A0A4U5PMH9_POPAL|nr:hypothetical protein D5086_0000206460 [Populus alba]
MDANWFNAFFDDHYENVMNNVGRYVSDGFAGTSYVSGFGGSYGDGYGNYNIERLGKTVQTNKGHDKGHTEATHTNKGNDKGQTEGFLPESLLEVEVVSMPTKAKEVEDKHNGAPVTSYEVTDFRDCCSDLGLADLNSTSCLYTWLNGHVWRKIDRFMVNTHCSTLQQQAHVHFDNPRAFSGHSPSSIQLGSRQPCRNRNFKFFNMWADHSQFFELTEQCWNTYIYGSYMFTLCRKLKLLKRPLKELNKLHYSHISQRVTRAEEELDSLQSLLHQDRDNIHLQSQDKHLRSQLLHLKSVEQSYYGQKLKFTFLKEANKGTRFFHALLSQKHRRNHIPAIQVPSDIYTSSVDEVGHEFVRYYKNLLGSIKQTIPINEDVIHCGPCLDAASHDFFLGPVTNDLIQQTLFNIGNEKALGPDDTHPCSLRKHGV